MITNTNRTKAALKSFAWGLLAVALVFSVWDYTLMRIYCYRVKCPGVSIGIRI